MSTNFPNGVSSYGIPLPSDVSIYSPFGQPYFVNGNSGSDGQPGTTPQSAFKTMARAFQFVQSLGSIGVIGQLEEQITAPLGISSVTIFGASTRPRYGNEGGSLTDYGACWRPAATPLATTPLLTVRNQGWRFVNMLFDCPADAAGVMLRRQEDATFPDGSSAQFIGCQFSDGATGIQDVGGNYNVVVNGCKFLALTSRSIYVSSTAIALPLDWQILNNTFMNVDGGITGAFSNALIAGNFIFDGATLHYANGKITTTGGVRNFVGPNYTYDVAADIDPGHGYTGVATDVWRTYAAGTADPVVANPPS